MWIYNCFFITNAPTLLLIILLCLTPDDFTHKKYYSFIQWIFSRYERAFVRDTVSYAKWESECNIVFIRQNQLGLN